MLQNFIPYIKGEVEKHEDILKELQQLKYIKCPVYSASLIR